MILKIFVYHSKCYNSLFQNLFQNIYLCFRKKFYRQIFGVAMGSPISVIVANLVTESIENKMLKDFASPSRICYITLMIFLLCLRKLRWYLFINF